MTNKLLETLTLAEDALHNMQNALLFVSGSVKDYSTSNMTADAHDDADKTLAAIREAKAELEKQEPVATMEVFSGWGDEANVEVFEDIAAKLPDGNYMLYAAPVSIEAAVQAEREMCAKVCETVSDNHAWSDYIEGCDNCAAAIRARREK